MQEVRSPTQPAQAPARRDHRGLRVVPCAAEAAPQDDGDALAAELVEQVKWAALLPYDKLQPQAQAFWRRLARAMQSMP